VGFFYFDESIHSRGEFILGAWVYAEENLNDLVHGALKEVGLIPNEDEFKSSALMLENPKQIKLREKLRKAFPKVRIGIVVIGLQERAILGDQALRGLRKIVNANCLNDCEHEVFLDEGLDFENRQDLVEQSDLANNCTFHFDQDSRKIGGFQLADLVAHTLSIVLLEKIGLVTKQVKAGENSGFEPDIEMALGFELWAPIRFNFFIGPKNIQQGIDYETGTVDIKPYALYVSDSCPSNISQAATERLGKTYYGCIH